MKKDLFSSESVRNKVACSFWHAKEQEDCTLRLKQQKIELCMKKWEQPCTNEWMKKTKTESHQQADEILDAILKIVDVARICAEFGFYWI